MAIPIYIHPTFWLLASFIAWAGSANLLEFGLWVLVVFVSVLVHEFGHALTATYWKQKVHIELVPLGGVTVRHGPALGKGKEFVIVLMGPLAGLLLAAVGYMLFIALPPIKTLTYFLNILVNVNIFWSILNLIPVQPLDGGKLLSIIMESMFGIAGVRYSYLLSALFALACTVLFFAVGSLIGGVLFLLFCYESFRAFLQERHVRASGEDEPVFKQIKKAEEDWQHNRPDEAIKSLEDILAKEPRGETYFRALESLAGLLLSSNQNEKAYEILKAHKSSLSDTLSRQMQLAAFKLGLWQESLDYGQNVFSELPESSSAILNAFATARLGRSVEAVNWLRAVRRINKEAFTSILQAHELDSIRSSKDFQELVHENSH